MEADVSAKRWNDCLRHVTSSVTTASAAIGSGNHQARNDSPRISRHIGSHLYLYIYLELSYHHHHHHHQMRCDGHGIAFRACL